MNVCERLVKDLKTVANIVKPCFPPEFEVLEIFVHSYETVIEENLDSMLEDMDNIVKTEPQAVLAFNKFILVCQEV